MIGDTERAKAVIEFSADTTSLKRGLADVNRAEDDFSRKQLERQNAHNARLDGLIKSYGSMVTVIGAAAVAGKLLWDGWEHNVKKAQLATNVAAGDLEKFRKGVGGLRNEMQSLEAVNKLQLGTYKLTSAQLEMVGRAMRQIARESGADLQVVTEKVTDAFVKLNGKGLDDFGIHVRDAKTDGEKFNAILDAMSAKAGKLNDTTQTGAERMAAMKVRFSDAMDAVRSSLGEIAVAFIPVLEALAKVAGYAAQIGNVIPGGMGTIGRVAKYGIPVYGQLSFVYDAATGNLYDKGKLKALGSGDEDAIRAAYERTSVGLEVESVTAVPRKTAKSASSEAEKEIERLAAAFDKMTRSPVRASLPGETGGGDAYQRYVDAEVERLSRPAETDLAADLRAHKGGADPWDKSQRQSAKLEAIFGPLSEFDAYKTAFETLNGAIGTAFGAWIDGSASAGQAFKKFIGEAMKGVAVQMAMEAVKHAAYAIGSLAFGNFAGAALHGKAAAGFAAGALVVGAAAKQLHGGGASSGGASAGAPGGGVPAYSGGGGGSQSGSNTIVVFGQDYTNDSARQRQQRAAKVMDDAKQATGGSGVSYA